MSSPFDQAFDIVVGHEGGFTRDARDPGNWTGKRCGVGELRGTKYGVSAASYPTLNIESLTIDDCKHVYKRDYWDKVRGDEMPPPLALIVFDAAVNCGVSRSAKWLQGAVGTSVDGVIGPRTLQAVAVWEGRGVELLVKLLVRRALFHVSLPTWSTFGEGWLRRLFLLPFQAMRMGL